MSEVFLYNNRQLLYSAAAEPVKLFQDDKSAAHDKAFWMVKVYQIEDVPEQYLQPSCSKMNFFKAHLVQVVSSI